MFGTNQPSAITTGTDKGSCELCGARAELRPYGPRGENICVKCGLKNKACTERQMDRVLFKEIVQ
jgi:hypothetical protein